MRKARWSNPALLLPLPAGGGWEGAFALRTYALTKCIMELT